MRILMAVACAALLSVISDAALAQGAPSPTAAQRMLKPGPEQNELMRQVGVWDVVASLWPAPGAEPIVMRGLIAERSMIGLTLQEIMRPAPGTDVPDFRRLDYLDFDRVEGRWKYVSIDTRFPVSIMPAWSAGPARDGKIEVRFAPQAFVGFGPDVEGRLMVSEMAISQPDADRVLKEQHAMMANGTGARWLFVRYEYTRRR